MNERTSGILLHLTSLPSEFGMGDLGPEAFRFVDFLEAAKQRLWQILPLNPTDARYDHSPYHSTSALAFNPLLISPELLFRDGWIEGKDLEEAKLPRGDRVDFPALLEKRKKLLDKAVGCFRKKGGNNDFDRFCARNASWLDDFALFTALRFALNEIPLHDWPAALRLRKAQALADAEKEHSEAIERTKIVQYLFFEQWTALKRYCSGKKITVLGDMPIYVEYNSVDLWTHPENFLLDEALKPYVVAGVPPDYYSETGQLWGNPLYDWKTLEQSHFDWWIRRMEHNLELFDLVRIDHFRGLVAYWEVKATEKTAMNGRWVEAPVMKFMDRLEERFPGLPVFAEDLGLITQDVKDVMEHYHLSGMKPILFAFGEDRATSPYLPENFGSHSVVYTGTHDNNTARGWFERDATPEEKKRLFEYLGREVSAREVPHELIRLAMMSRAEKAIIPVQDLLGLGGEARMNDPSTMEGNWRFRLGVEYDTAAIREQLIEWTETSDRA